MTETAHRPVSKHVDIEVNPEKDHTIIELGNVYRCCKIEDEWLKDNHTPSMLYISQLHHTLFEGVESYRKKGISPLPPGSIRKTDIRVTGEPDNFYVRGLDLGPIMDQYTKQLDALLTELPKSPIGKVDDIVSKAAWAYYVFERAHPFLDGNGRIGRMILRRFLRGGGFRDIIFTNETIQGTKRHEEYRNKHLDAMNQIDKTGNLSYLEVYIAKLLLAQYQNGQDGVLNKELSDFINSKKEELSQQKQKKTIGEIWRPFEDLDIYGQASDSFSFYSGK